jgi:hypothetical protein
MFFLLFGYPCLMLSDKWLDISLRDTRFGARTTISPVG